MSVAFCMIVWQASKGTDCHMCVCVCNWLVAHAPYTCMGGVRPQSFYFGKMGRVRCQPFAL